MNDNDAPQEVKEVWIWRSIPMGTDRFNECQRIIEKYPEWFPWEHKYKAIPLDVHEKYREEYDKASDRRWKRVEKRRKERHKNTNDYKLGDKFTLEVLKEIIGNLSWEKEVMRKEEKNWNMTKKKIWNKYYKQYKLEYRE